MKKNHFLTRRDFLHNAAAIGAAISIPSIVPSTVFGANAPSNRITMGMIGMGGQMGGHLRFMLSRHDVQVVAVCDVDLATNVKMPKAMLKGHMHKIWQVGHIKAVTRIMNTRISAADLISMRYLSARRITGIR